MRRYTICCLGSGREVVPPNAKMYDVLPLLWFRRGALILTCTIYCYWFGFEVVP